MVADSRRDRMMAHVVLSQDQLRTTRSVMRWPSSRSPGGCSRWCRWARHLVPSASSAIPAWRPICAGRYAAITAGYHLNKRHWNTVTLDGSVPEEEVLELVDHSYDLVLAGLTRTQRNKLIT
jgi:YjbR